MRSGVCPPARDPRRAPGRAARVAGWIALAILAPGPAGAQRDPGWEVRVPERIEVAAGATVQLPIALAVDRGLTVSRDAAVIIDLAPDDGVTVKKRRLGRGDAVDPDADAPRFAATLHGDAPGEHAVRLRVRFWLCRTRTCRPIDVRRVATVAVGAETSRRDAGFGPPRG